MRWDGMLLLEDAREEELLELLVTEVDAELLEGVVLEVLKAEDVEQADVTVRWDEMGWDGDGRGWGDG